MTICPMSEIVAQASVERNAIVGQHKRCDDGFYMADILAEEGYAVCSHCQKRWRLLLRTVLEPA
jgi:hypothetical protein